MFQAYSIKKSDKINASDVSDFKDTFLCIFCRAQMTLKAVNSTTKRPYFAKIPSSPHINCPCNLFGSVSENITGYEKFDISDILNNSPLSIKSDKHSNNNNNRSKNASEAIERISTPKRLLKYCLSHDINSEYKDGILICDVCLDTRNILANNNYNGFDGIRLVVGKTIMYFDDKDQRYFTFIVNNPSNKSKTLTAKVNVSKEQIIDIRNYIFNTYQKFSLHPIAVLGEWTKTGDNTIECTVTRPANVIYRFANE